MHSISTIQSARLLRTQGKTYSDIQRILKQGFHKSTLSYWFKDLDLTTEQKALLKTNVDKKLIIAQKKWQKLSKERRVIYFNKLKNKNLFLLPKIDNHIQKLILSVLYLGEGSKSKSTQNLSLGSSSPKIIKLYLSLLKSCFQTDISKFRIRIQCRDDQDITKLENFWHEVTQISKNQFYPTYIDKRSIGKPTLHKDYMGVCAVMYFDRSIQFELELLSDSMIEYITKGL